tara:strand:- start:1548 stop:2165 length:618 start_codon:yes stop_codon:yes gene_type:complete
MAGPINFFRVMQHSQFPPETVPCNAATVNFTGSQGVFLAEAIVLGNGIGGVTASFNSFNIVDRFQLIYDGSIVADSLFVGGLLSSTGGYNTEVAQLSGPQTQSIFKFNYATQIFTDTGQTEEFLITSASFPPFSDGETNLRSTGSLGAQVGINPGISSSLRCTAGKVALSFNKTTAQPSNFTIKVFGDPTNANTGWELEFLTCPT